MYEKPEARSQRCSVKKVFLKNSQHSQENTFARVLFRKVAGLRPVTLLKNRLWHRCFPVSFAKFLRTPFFYWKHPVAASEKPFFLIFCQNSWNVSSDLFPNWYLLVQSQEWKHDYNVRICSKLPVTDQKAFSDVILVFLLLTLNRC